MIKVVKTSEQYKEYLDRYKKVKGIDEGDLLLVLIADYEDRTYPLEFYRMEPVEIIKERMKQMGLRNYDLYKHGIDKYASNRVLHKKMKMSIDVIRRFSSVLDLPIELLTKDYQLRTQ